MDTDAPNDEMKEIVNDFLVESQEVLDALDQRFVALEKNPNDTALLNEIFRAAHSVKGSAGFLGFTQLVEVAHQTESILNLMRQREMSVEPALVDTILEAVDLIKLLLKDIKDTGADTHVDVSETSAKLAATLQRSAVPPKEPPARSKSQRKKSEAAACADGGSSVSTQPAPTSEPLDRLPAALAPGDEELHQEDVPLSEKPAAEKARAKEAKIQGAGHAGDDDQTIRVETRRLDHVMNLVGELVLGRNRMMKLSAGLEQAHEGDSMVREVSETLGRLDLVTTDLQTAVMRTRMLPIRKVLGKFPRMVRDLANKVGKKVTLELAGEETELDKSVIEEIGDPLVHLVRNAIDHGIETPEERRASGKPELGTVRLEAAQEGDRIIIRISDDGRGMAVEKIKAKALHQGLVTAQEISIWERSEILNLIFQPGFSTAAQVTDVSGRGVGMDVVRTNISRLNGSVEVETEEGRGSTVTIKLPLTIAIIQALMVSVGRQVFAIPLTSVIEAVKLCPNTLKTVNGREVMTLRDQVLPLLRVASIFDVDNSERSSAEEGRACGVPPGDTTRLGASGAGGCDREVSAEERSSGYVVVVAVGERRLGILVDRLQAQEEVVIKPLGDFLGDIAGVAGATITGEGKVVLILDMAELVQSLHPRRAIVNAK